jgi:hypothetical protein
VLLPTAKHAQQLRAASTHARAVLLMSVFVAEGMRYDGHRSWRNKEVQGTLFPGLGTSIATRGMCKKPPQRLAAHAHAAGCWGTNVGKGRQQKLAGSLLLGYRQLCNAAQLLGGDTRN